MEHAAPARARLVGTDRRDLILAAAARLLWDRGEEGATMRDIGAASGVLMSTLYYYFASKEDLIRAVHQEGVERIVARVEAAIAAETDPWARFSAAAVAHLEAILDPDPFCRVVQLPLPRAGRPHRAAVIALRDRYENIQRRLIAELPLDPAVSPTLLRLGFIGMMNAVPNWYRPGGLAPAEIARRFVRMLRAGVAAAEGRQPRPRPRRKGRPLERTGDDRVVSP